MSIDYAILKYIVETPNKKYEFCAEESAVSFIKKNLNNCRFRLLKVMVAEGDFINE